MDIKTAKRIPITDFLAALGHEPKSVRGADWWYASPLRNERTPSFKVDVNKNVWYDHGEGVGGTIIDLSMRMNGGCGISEALRSIAQASGKSIPLPAPARAIASPRASPEKPSASEIESVQALSDAQLVRYMEEVRALPLALAEPYVRQVAYRTADGGKYVAIGFQNRAGGFELRSPRFKGSIGTKDVTVVGDPQGGQVRVFEGFLDFLSARVLWPEEKDSPALVLNSVSMAARGAEELLRRGCSATCLVDADLAGSRAVAAFREILGNEKTLDARVRLGGSKDVNELLVKRRDERNLAFRRRTPSGNRS
jgi:hypothetical protein